MNSIPGVLSVGWQDDPAPYLAISDTMVFPSARERMSVCVMEALAMGFPVVTLDSRGCRDVVCNGVNGMVLGQADVGELNDAIDSLCLQPELLKGMRNGVLRRRSLLSWQQYFKEQLKLLDQVVNNWRLSNGNSAT